MREVNLRLDRNSRDIWWIDRDSLLNRGLEAAVNNFSG